MFAMQYAYVCLRVSIGCVKVLEEDTTQKSFALYICWFVFVFGVLCFSLPLSSVCLGVDICLRSIWGGGERKKFCIVSRWRAIALLPSVPETNCSTDKNRLLF